MNEEEKFDELLRSKLTEREFPFDEVNWDEAERLIVKQEKWRKISRFSLVFSAGLLVGVFTMLPFILNTHTTPPGNIVSESKTSQSAVSKNSNQLPVNQPIVNSGIKNSNKTSHPISSSITKNTNDIRKHTLPNSPSAITKTVNEQPSSMLKEVSKTMQSNQPNTSGLVVSAGNTDKVTEHAETNKNVEKNIAGETSTESPSPVSNNIPSEKPAKNKDTTNIPKNTVVKTNKTPASNRDKVKKPSTNISPTVKNVTYQKTPKDSNKENSPPLLRVTPPMMDTAKFAANIFLVYAGAGYSAGWNNNGTEEGNGITPLGGFAFTHYFTRKIAASIGIGYSELSNLNKTYTSSSIQYDFGASTHIITVEPQTVYYVAFPLVLQYNLTGKNKINLGVDYLIMLTTRSTLNSFQQTYFSESFVSSETENGYTQGFSNYDLQITLSYTRMLTGRLGLGIEGYLGLVSIENSSFPGITQFEKNRGGRLVLSYQIIK